MKRSSHPGRGNQTGSDDPQRRYSRNRYEMNRLARGFLIFLLLVLIAAILLAGYATLYPVIFSWTTPVLRYQRESRIDYAVLVRPNDFSDQSRLGMDQAYLQDLTEAIDITFFYRYRTDRDTSRNFRFWIDAALQVRDAASPSTVLLHRQINLKPVTAAQSTGSEVQLTENILVRPADYADRIAAFAAQSDLAVNYTLAVTLMVQVDEMLPGGPLQVADSPTLLIPLNQKQFQLTRLLPETQPVLVRQLLTWQLVLAPLPLPVFPAAAGICFLLIIVILTATRGRKKDKFDIEVRRMLRRARSRLMIIGVKAWEPEWCVTVNDFRSMVRTARKLKHPLFCFIDRKSETPAVYFYVYYGENNYCFTYGKPGESTPVPDFAASDEIQPEEPDDFIPVLPENDDSPEIILARLRVQTN